MSESQETPLQNNDGPQEVFQAVDSVANQLSVIQTFIARRFDELSMEINATSQQVDMAEEGIGQRFAEILDILKAVSFSGDGNTPANAGIELGAVVEMTERAANNILDAAERIGARVDEEFKDGDDLNAAKKDIQNDVETIVMACSFQDITGQRIRKALENLQAIEDRLGSALGKIGVDVEATELQSPPIEITKAASQNEIDELFD